MEASLSQMPEFEETPEITDFRLYEAGPHTSKIDDAIELGQDGPNSLSDNEEPGPHTDNSIEQNIDDGNIDPNTADRVVEVEKKDKNDEFEQFKEKIKQIPRLTKAQELELAKRRENGDLGARKKLIESTLREAVYLARYYLGRGLDEEELIHEGVFGVIRAVDKFDWRKGYRLKSYAKFWVASFMQRAADQKGHTIHTPELVRKYNRKIEDAYWRLMTQLGREPSLEEVAKSTKLKLEDVQDVVEICRVIRTTSLDIKIGRPGSYLELKDVVPDERQIVEEVVEETDDTVGLEDIMKQVFGNKKFHIAVAERFYLREQKEAEVARALNLSQFEVREIKKEAQASLKRFYETRDGLSKAA